MNKTCSKCKERKPISEFYKYSRSPDGIYYQCKTCQYPPHIRESATRKTVKPIKAILEIKTPSDAKKYIESQGIKIEPGMPYNIYMCGCVIRVDEDPFIQVYFSESKYKNRTCPNHKPSALLNKFKQCNCGLEYLGKRLQVSKSCRSCWTSKSEKTKNNKFCKQGEKKENPFKNIHLQDPERSNCKHYLMRCLRKYDKYDAVPCLNCNQYEMAHGNVDFKDRTTSTTPSGKSHTGPWLKEEEKVGIKTQLPVTKSRGISMAQKQKEDNWLEREGRKLRDSLIGKGLAIKSPRYFWYVAG